MCVTPLWDLAQRGPRLTNPGCRSNARARALLNERWKDGDGARTGESQLYRRVESAPKETRTRLSCKDLTVQSLRDIAETCSGPCTARIDESPLCYGALGSQQAQQVNAVDFGFKRTLTPSGPSRSSLLPNRERSVTRAVSSTGSLAHPSEIHFLLNSATRAVTAFATHRSCKLFIIIGVASAPSTLACFAAHYAISSPHIHQIEGQKCSPNDKVTFTVNLFVAVRLIWKGGERASLTSSASCPLSLYCSLLPASSAAQTGPRSKSFATAACAFLLNWCRCGTERCRTMHFNPPSAAELKLRRSLLACCSHCCRPVRLGAPRCCLAAES